MKKNNRIRKATLLALFCGGFYLLSPYPAMGTSPLEIDVWLDKGDGNVYYADEALTVYFKVNHSSYVTIYNIDTDGYVSILYPFYPGMDSYVAGGKVYSIPGGGYDLSLYIEEPVGVGYMEAIASYEPFYLDGWPFLSQSYESAGGVEEIRRITGDPFISIDEINQEILPYSEDLEYHDDFAIYYVEEVVHYPRYLCSDCHSSSYYHYDPYNYSCPSYNIVVYDYWYYNDYFYWDYYYPYGYYGYYYPYGYYGYYYPYDYYGYYYRFPRSSHHYGQRYSRKYGYRTREEGIYRSKGESTLSPGAIRVREREDGGARYSAPVTVSESGNGGRSSASFKEKTRVDDFQGDITPRSSHSNVRASIREDAGYHSSEETVSRRAEGARSENHGRNMVTAPVTVTGEGGSTRSVEKAASRRVDGNDTYGRAETRRRSAGKLSDSTRETNRTYQRNETVHERENRDRTHSSKRPVRVEESRTQSSRNHISQRSERNSVRGSGSSVSRGSRQSGQRGRGGAEVRRSSSRTNPQRGSGVRSGSRRPSPSR